MSASDSDSRMAKFAGFFRGYMGSAPVIAAALPIPVTAGKVIPTYAETTAALTAYTSMLCFLIVAFVFYRRHRIGTYLLPSTWGKRSRIIGRFYLSWLPMFCILLTLSSIASYHAILDTSLLLQGFGPDMPLAQMLASGTVRELSAGYKTLFYLSYLGIFLFPTLAFALMAVREYMQVELQLTDAELVSRSGDPAVENTDA